VLDLAKAMPQGPNELAKGLFHLESVGLRGAKAMDALKIAAEGAASATPTSRRPPPRSARRGS
jgi:hypothetical protein